MARIEGTWEAYLDDFIVNYGEDRRIGSVVYSNKLDKRGFVKAKVWQDKNQNGIKDKNEKWIAKYKADAKTVYYELDYYSFESGDISIDTKSGKFTLEHEGYAFGNGRILDMNYFF